MRIKLRFIYYLFALLCIVAFWYIYNRISIHFNISRTSVTATNSVQLRITNINRLNIIKLLK